MKPYQEDIFITSKHIENYQKIHIRTSMGQLYDSEKVTLHKVLPYVNTVTDVGCLFGDLYAAMSENHKISYRGLDVDDKAKLYMLFQNLRKLNCL